MICNISSIYYYRIIIITNNIINQVKEVAVQWIQILLLPSCITYHFVIPYIVTGYPFEIFSIIKINENIVNIIADSFYYFFFGYDGPL